MGTTDVASVESQAAARVEMVDVLREHGLDPSDWMDTYDELGVIEDSFVAGKPSDAETVTSFVEMAAELEDDYDFLDPKENPSLNSEPLPGSETHQCVQ